MVTRRDFGRRGLALALAFSSMPLSGLRAASIDPEGAARHVRELSARAVAAFGQGSLSLAEREARVAALLRAGFDIPLIARFALGKTWRRSTPRQQADYLILFERYIVRTMAHRFGQYSGERIIIQGTRAAGKKDIYVDSVIRRQSGRGVAAAWRVRAIQGRPRVIDVTVEGISMALTQRQEFAAILRQNGIVGLIEVLRAKTGRLSAVSG